MSDYLHGAQTIRESANTREVSGADTAITVLIGTAPVFDAEAENRKINEIVDITPSKNYVKFFGKTYSGYTIPAALEDFYNQCSGRIFVINVFDPDKHKANISGSKTFKDGVITLEEKGIFNLKITKENTECILNTDYTFENNTITVKDGGNLTKTDTVTVAYDYADVSKVTPAEIIGGIDEDGKKYGAELAKDIKAVYGVKPKIIIAPGYSCLNQVRAALEVLANKLKAVLYADAPLNTSLDDVIKGRGKEGDINFNTSNERVMLYHHHYKTYNKAEDKYQYRYASSFMAGLRVRLDREKGVHYSSSNNPIYGAEGVDVPVSFELNDIECDANILNSQGIVTTINDGGTLKVWGNRNASFPSSNGLMTFESCLRTIDYFEESIENYVLSEMDNPINSVTIDRILQKLTNFGNREKKKGTTLDFEAWFDESKNPPDQLQNGFIVFSYACCPAPPLERVRFLNDVQVKYLKEIGGEN